ncbi:MAG: MoxR family ATPase [Acidobacteria bacterium]|nr:MoxR family ATPase [Acidobacteriota bacterium]MBV9476499.1 MoxR family ATPase [Acidobacteriota bacterium]
MASEALPISRSLDRIAALQANVERVIRGKSEVVQFCIAALLAKGHILLEDVPGVGKTTLAHALARSLSLEFQRVQFTSDLLPADIVGVTIYNQDQQEFEFVSGPIFTNVLLADEINRATPKSQSALLEAMSEGTITVEKRRMPLPEPFLVIATQNPIEHVGTYPLPESQLDRFLMKLTIGYPNAADERKLLREGGGQNALEHLEPVMSGDELRALQARVDDIHVSEPLVEYLMTIVQTTRAHADVALGVSTRGALTFFKACQALAMVSGRDFVVPDDVKRLATPVLSHRIVMKDRRLARGEQPPEAKFIARIVGELAVPR